MLSLIRNRFSSFCRIIVSQDKIFTLSFTDRINGRYTPARNGQGHKFLQIIKVIDLNIFDAKLSAASLQLLSARPLVGGFGVQKQSESEIASKRRC